MKKNINNVLAVLVIVLSLIVIAMGVYIVVNKDEKEVISNDKVELKDLTIDNAIVNLDGPNHHLIVTGKMNLSFDEDEDNDTFKVVNLSGYCLGQNDEKYLIHGPQSGVISFHNGETELSMGNTINNQTGDVFNSDGTVKPLDDVDWSKVKIKYCKVDKMIVYISEKDGNLASTVSTTETELNYEKYFE